MNKSALCLIGAIAFSGGCTSYVENQASLEFDPIYLAATPQPDAVVPTGAIYKASSQGLFATDIRARGVGDILTVALAETFTATKSQSTSSSKVGVQYFAMCFGRRQILPDCHANRNLRRTFRVSFSFCIFQSVLHP